MQNSGLEIIAELTLPLSQWEGAYSLQLTDCTYLRRTK